MNHPLYHLQRLDKVKYKHEEGDPVFDLLHEYLYYRNKYLSSDYEVVTLKERVKVLEAENNFMLRLINERITTE